MNLRTAPSNVFLADELTEIFDGFPIISNDLAQAFIDQWANSVLQIPQTGLMKKRAISATQKGLQQ